MSIDSLQKSVRRQTHNDRRGNCYSALNNDTHYVYIDTVFLHLENLEGVLSQKVSNLIFIIKHAYLHYIHTNICNPFFSRCMSQNVEENGKTKNHGSGKEESVARIANMESVTNFKVENEESIE